MCCKWYKGGERAPKKCNFETGKFSCGGFVRNNGTLRVDPPNHIDENWRENLNPFKKKTTNYKHSRKHKRDSPDQLIARKDNLIYQ